MRREQEKTKPYLSVVIPAYNEEKRLGKTLDIVYTYLQKQPFVWEILIVLDGPTDNTLGVLEAFAQDKAAPADKEQLAEGQGWIRWIGRRENRGKGYTIREGMLAACGDIRLFADADNSTDISHFDKMKPLFAQGYSVVIGSRDSKDVPGALQAVPQPFLKRVLGDAGNLFIQVMTVPGIWDTQCGFKAFTAPAAQKIFSVARSNGWVFDSEVLALARRYGFKIGIVAAHWIDDVNTHVSLRDYLAALWETVKIRWQLMTGFYARQHRANADPLIAPSIKHEA